MDSTIEIPIPLSSTTDLYSAMAQRPKAISSGPAASSFEAGGRYYSPVTYYWPDYYRGEGSQWNKVLRFGRDLGIVILNRDSGNWEAFDRDFEVQAKLAKAAGARKAIFYVKTQYGAAGNPAKWGGGVPNAEKFTHEYILQQIAFAKKHYGALCEGVFLDEFINGWGDHAARLEWYKGLVDAIRSKYGKGFFVVGNCGSNCSPEVLGLDVDVFMSYESTAEKYLNPPEDSPIHPAHMAEQPGTRFWHVVHDVTTENYQAVFAQAERFGVGHLYITDGRLVMGAGGQWDPEVNPYAVAPGDWITDILKSWLRGILEPRLAIASFQARLDALTVKVEELAKRVAG